MIKARKIGKNKVVIIRNKKSGLKLTYKENTGFFINKCRECVYGGLDSCIIDGMILLCDIVREQLEINDQVYFPRRQND